MSIQAGIRNFDGRNVSSAEIEFLLQGYHHLCFDYSRISLSQSVGIGFLGTLLAPEDKEDQPLVASSGVRITLDGRLDNRRELYTTLGIPLAVELSDARLTLAAYEHFGKECFDRLQGEVAAVIWDRRINTLFLFRSLCGTRPLYYAQTRGSITWSSNLADLVLKSGVEPVINDAYAIGYAYYQPDIDESPFRNVVPVPCGTYVAVRDDGEFTTPVSVWHPEKLSTLRLRSDAEYEEAWKDQVRNAISLKLRARRPVFCELSGGLDSTTLVFGADQVLRGTGRSTSELTTVSITFETSTTCDETHFIRIAEATRGRTGVHISESALEATFGLKDSVFTGVPNANRFTPGRYASIARAMKNAGARVLLTGTGGDHLFWSNQNGSPELADLLAQWHLRTLISQGREWSRVARVPLWQMLLKHAIWPIGVMTPLAPWLMPDLEDSRWLTQMARKFLVRKGRDQGMRLNKNIDLPSRRVREMMVRSLRALLSSGYFQEYDEIYFSHPYANGDLINFVLSLPMNQLVRPGQDRVLMRGATRGLLPEPIRTRRSKGTIDELPCRVLARELPEIGDPANLEVCQRGYADPKVLAKEMIGIAAGRTEHSYSFLRLMNVEQWLRSLRTIEARRHSLKEEAALSLVSFS
jgi:asparagine synthase (glutamine-hydrolysing)